MAIPANLAKMNTKETREFKQFLGNLEDKDLSKRLTMVQKQLKKALDDNGKKYGMKTVGPEFEKGIENLTVLEKLIIGARAGKGKGKFSVVEECVDYCLGEIEGPALFEEGINDKNLFKMVFLAGGGGSGKGYIAKKIFEGHYTPVVNTDDMFEYLLQKNNVSMKIDTAMVELYAQQSEIRGRAKASIAKRKNDYTNGMLPLVMDGTGKDYAEIAQGKKYFESLGYDTALVFVNTSLDVALARNKARARSVPVEIATNNWHEVQQNLGKFQTLFGTDMTIVDNSKTLDDEGQKVLSEKMAKLAIKLLDKPLKNRKGIVTIELLKRIGGKYLSDLPPNQ